MTRKILGIIIISLIAWEICGSTNKNFSKIEGDNQLHQCNHKRQCKLTFWLCRLISFLKTIDKTTIIKPGYSKPFFVQHRKQYLHINSIGKVDLHYLWILHFWTCLLPKCICNHQINICSNFSVIMEMCKVETNWNQLSCMFPTEVSNKMTLCLLVSALNQK